MEKEKTTTLVTFLRRHAAKHVSIQKFLESQRKVRTSKKGLLEKEGLEALALKISNQFEDLFHEFLAIQEILGIPEKDKIKEISPTITERLYDLPNTLNMLNVAFYDLLEDEELIINAASQNLNWTDLHKSSLDKLVDMRQQIYRWRVDLEDEDDGDSL